MRKPRLPRISHEMLEATLSVLESFAAELADCAPPTVPYESIASARGWSMRLTTVREKLASLTAAEVLAASSRLARILSALDSYIRAFDVQVAKTDPLLEDYEWMPGDRNEVDSIRILAERTNIALYECVAVHFRLDDESVDSH